MRLFAVAVAVAVAASVLVACSASPPQYRTVTVGVDLSVAVPATAPKITAMVSSARIKNERLLRQLAPAEHLTAAGTLPSGGVLLTFHLDPRKVGPGTRPFLASLDERTGQWIAVPSDYDPKTGAVSARVQHFSVWAPLGWVTSQVIAMLRGALPGIFGFGGTGTYPQCSSYDVTVTDNHPGGTAIGACAESLGHGQVEVKVANIRPYLLDVTYPDISGNSADAGSSATIVSPDVIMALLTVASAKGHVLLPGFGESDIDFPLSPGGRAQITTRLDGQAFRAAMLELAAGIADRLGGKAEELARALNAANCAIDYLRASTASTLTEQAAEDAGSAAFQCVGSLLPKTASLVLTGVTVATTLIGTAIAQSWALIDTALGTARHVLTVQLSAAPSCTSAAAIDEVLPPQLETPVDGHQGRVEGITCVGPYVTANLIFTSSIGTGLLLKQEVSGLQFLAAGTGPRCTTNPAYAEPGQVVYVPPQYGHALDCIT